jgi:hypothetical protein
LLEESRRLAAASGDLALQARASMGSTFSAWLRLHDDTQAMGEESVDLARRAGDAAVEQMAWNQVACGSLWLGRVEPAKRALRELERLADQLRTPLARYLPLGLASTLAILEGRFDEALALNRDSRQVAGLAAGGSNLAQWAGTRFLVVTRLRGLPVKSAQALDVIAPLLGYNIYRATLCGVYISSGDRNEALRELGILATDDFGRVARDGNWHATLTLAADHTWELEEPRYAEALYSHLLPFAGRCPGVGTDPLIVCLGPIDLRLGRLALLLGRERAAQAHLEETIAIAGRMGALPVLAQAHHALAVLLSRHGADGRARSLEELGRALDLGQRLGMSGLVRDGLALRGELAAAASDDRTLSL